MIGDSSGLATGLSDVRNVEYRLAQIGGDGVSTSDASARRSAFTTLLDASPDSAAPAPSGGHAPLPAAAFERVIAAAAAASGNDPALVKAIVANESSFDPLATSPTGAAGLMQLMPATAAENGVSDAYDPAQNVAGGTRYLARMLRRFNGDVPLALAAYNAGPEAIARGDVPPETQNYVRSVLTSYARYRAEETSERPASGAAASLQQHGSDGPGSAE